MTLDWAADASDFTGVSFAFDAQNFTNWTCVVDATGDNRTFFIQDAAKKEPNWGNPFDVMKPHYGQKFPCAIKLDASQFNEGTDKDGNAADYTNIGVVVFGKETEKEAKSLTITSIKFYKNDADVPTAE